MVVVGDAAHPDAASPGPGRLSGARGCRGAGRDGRPPPPTCRPAFAAFESFRRRRVAGVVRSRGPSDGLVNLRPPVLSAVASRASVLMPEGTGDRHLATIAAGTPSDSPARDDAPAGLAVRASCAGVSGRQGAPVSSGRSCRKSISPERSRGRSSRTDCTGGRPRWWCTETGMVVLEVGVRPGTAGVPAQLAAGRPGTGHSPRRSPPPILLHHLRQCHDEPALLVNSQIPPANLNTRLRSLVLTARFSDITTTWSTTNPVNP